MNNEGRSIAVVGGGISGLFCALMLAKLGFKVTLFESSNRLGGRISSIRMQVEDSSVSELGPNWTSQSLVHCAEFGPMRIELDKQLLLKGLLETLEITDAKTPQQESLPHIVEFPPYTAVQTLQDPVFNLQANEQGLDSMQLLQLAILRILFSLSLNEENPSDEDRHAIASLNKQLSDLVGDCTKAMAVGWSVLPVFIKWTQNLNEDNYWVLQTRGIVNGTPLYNQGFWNLIDDHLSHDATKKLAVLGSFYHLIYENPNAAEWVTWWLRGFSITENLKGVYGGMESIVEKLQVKLTEAAVVVKLNYELERIRITSKDQGGTDWYELSFINDEEEPLLPRKQDNFDHVVLALHRSALEKLYSNSTAAFTPHSGHYTHILESVFSFPMVKVFVVVKKRWWEEETRTNQYSTRIPTRELHFWKGANGSSTGMIMGYSDSPASSFWASYVPTNSQGIYKATPGDPIYQKIVKLVNDNGVPEFRESDILWIGLKDWGRAPYNGANHAWRPGVKYWEHIARLGIAKSKDKSNTLHVCGEAFSDYHGFMEGSLRSAVYAMYQLVSEVSPALDFFEFLKHEIGLDHKYATELRVWCNRLANVVK